MIHDMLLKTSADVVDVWGQVEARWQVSIMTEAGHIIAQQPVTASSLGFMLWAMLDHEVLIDYCGGLLDYFNPSIRYVMYIAS